MRLVMLHVVHLSAKSGDVGIEGSREGGARIAHTRRVLKAILQVTGARAVADGAQELLADVRPRIAGDGDVVELLGAQPALLEAPRSREAWESGDMLDSVEPFFLGGGDQLAVDDERCRSIAVIGIQAENCRHAGERSC